MKKLLELYANIDWQTGQKYDNTKFSPNGSFGVGLNFKLYYTKDKDKHPDNANWIELPFTAYDEYELDQINKIIIINRVIAIKYG